MASKSIAQSAPRRQAGEGQTVIAAQKSQNEKLGAVSATTVTIESCGPCPLKNNGCYAQQGPLGWMVSRMNKHVQANDITIEQIASDEAAAIDGLWSGLPLRLHVAGDCRTNETAAIVSAAAERYTARNAQPAWTYTHAWRAVDRASWGAVSVLASCETPADALAASERGYAPAMVVEEYPNGKRAWTLPTGQTAIPCPEMTGAAASCADCRLCMGDQKLRDRNVVIAFEVHGAQSKKASLQLQMLNA